MITRTAPKNRDADSTELGAVTAEFAVMLPAVTAVLALCLGAVSTGTAQVRLEETARVSARAAARGDSAERIRQIAASTDREATVSITRDSGTVHISAERKAPGMVGATTGWMLHAQATASIEGAKNTE